MHLRRPGPAALALFSLCLVVPDRATAQPAESPRQEPAAPRSGSQPLNELDAFMEKVLARREVNRKTLDQNVPDTFKSDTVWDVVSYLRSALERTDTSLIEEWESLVHPELRFQGEDAHASHRRLVAEELTKDPRRLSSRVRAELHALVGTLSRRDWEEAALAVRQPTEGAEGGWTPDRFEASLAPFFERFETLVFDHRSRLADKTTIGRTGEFTWSAVQVLCDPDGEDLWCIEATVDLGEVDTLEGPIIAVERIGE